MKRNGLLPRSPRVGCAALVRRGKSVLLGRRKKQPNQGIWVLPGGGIRFGETFQNTIRREIFEEAGIKIRFNGVIGAKEIIRTLVTMPVEHRVIVFVYADYIAGEPVAASDLSEVGFFTRRQILKMWEAGSLSKTTGEILQEEKILPAEPA